MMLNRADKSDIRENQTVVISRRLTELKFLQGGLQQSSQFTPTSTAYQENKKKSNTKK